MRLSRAEPPGHAPEHSGCDDHRILLGLLIMARLIRDQSVLLSVALAATLWSSAALPQAEAETEVAPSQPVETIPTAPPAPPRPVSDEPTSASTPPVVAPNTASSSETAPAPLPTGAPTSGPLESAAVPLPTEAPTSRPVESPAQAPKGSLAAGPKERHSATTLIVVNGRAVSNHSGCAGWNKGGGAFRVPRAQHQGRP